MKKLILFIISTLSFHIIIAQNPKPKLGGGSIPPTEVIYGQKFTIEEIWTSIGPYPMMQTPTYSNDKTKKVRTAGPVKNNSQDGWATNLFYPGDNSIAVSNSNPPSWNRKVVALRNSLAEFFEHDFTPINSTGLNFWVNNSASFPTSTGFFDPRIIYDPKADRFIAAILYIDDQITKANSNLIIMVSKDGNPANGWTGHKIAAPTGWWYDFPYLGMSENDIYITVNQLTAPGAGMVGTDIFQIPKFDLYNSSAWSAVTGNMFDDVTDIDGGKNRGICVVTAGDLSLTGYGPGVFLVSHHATVNNSKFTLYDIVDDYNIIIPTMNKYDALLPQKVLQPGVASQTLTQTNNGLDCGGSKIHSAYFLDQRIHLAMSGTTTPSNTQAAIWYGNFELNSLNLLIDQITPNTNSGTKEWFSYPSICHAGTSVSDKTSAICYLASGELYNPQIRAVIIDDNFVQSQPTTFRDGDGYLIHNGTAPNANKVMKWGDYTGIQKIYDAPCPQFALVGTFGNNNNQYATFVADSKCVTTDVENTDLFKSAIKLYPNPTHNELNIEIDSKLNQKLNFSISNLEGKVIRNFDYPCGIGFNRATITVENLQVGFYFLTIYTENNESSTHKFFKN